MTPLRKDDTLVLPEAPAQVPALWPVEGGLAIAGPARQRPFLAEGHFVTIVGSQRGAIERVSIGGRVVASEIRAGDGTAVNVVTHPGAVSRELVGKRGTWLETVLALPNLPVAVVQWGAPDTQIHDRFCFALRADAESTGYNVGHSSIVLDHGDGTLTAIGVTPQPTSLDVTDEGSVRVTARPSGTGPVTLVIVAGGPRSVRSGFAAAAHLATHARVASAGPIQDGLVLRSGVAEIDEGVQWARWRLRTTLARADLDHDGSPGSAMDSALAALGTGDEDSARSALRVMSRREPGRARSLAERYLAVFGTRPSLRDVGRADREDRPGLSLPVVGGDRARELHESSHDRLPSLFVADPDAAWTQWRALLTSGLEGGPAGPGSWDEVGPAEGRVAPTTSALLSALAYGLLGLDPDAPVGRIGIAPRFPSHMRSLVVEGVTVGSSRIRLEYRREGGVHRFVLEPTIAGVPPMVVFEPSLPGRVREVRIDGAPGDLDIRPEGTRTVVPLQLPLDATRVIEIDSN